MAESTLKQKREERRSRRQQPVSKAARATTLQEAENGSSREQSPHPKKGVATPSRRKAEDAEQEEKRRVTSSPAHFLPSVSMLRVCERRCKRWLGPLEKKRHT
ncbi:MAG UNVERIFIED_CONTAM: hypothetical protein LVT10_11525 [Anaerolineae bacterium]|jgi:hypothetical protein